MRLVKDSLITNYRLVAIPESYFEAFLLLARGFSPIGGTSRSKWYSKSKYATEPESMPFDIHQKVLYTGNDTHLLMNQRIKGYLTVSGFYDKQWLNLDCSPMSYPVKDFQAL